MSGLQRVSFKKGRARAPRISPVRVPGRHSDRFWTEEQKEILRKYYPDGGHAACAAHLPPERRSPSSIYVQAHKLGLRSNKGPGGPKQSIQAPANIDDILRREYEQQDGKKRGAINVIADKLGLPRWWVTKRATKLGLVMPHKKEPPWTAAETALMRKVPLHNLERCSEIFRDHGFSRSPTAIMVRAKRLDISRRFREGFSAGQAAKVVGFDNKTMGIYCIAGDCKATRRADKRSPQQGGARWIIKREDLRAFVLANLERIDLRKVEKFAFVQLIAGEPLEKAPPAGSTPRKPARRRRAKSRRRFAWVDDILRKSKRRA